MADSVKFGAVLFWKGFEFDDGGVADKLFIVLGAQVGKNVIAAICTSKQKGKKLDPGCNAKAGYYFIPGKRDGFPVDTWALLFKPYVFAAARLDTVLKSKAMIVRGQIRPEVAAALRNCLKKTDDVTGAQLALLE